MSMVCLPQWWLYCHHPNLRHTRSDKSQCRVRACPKWPVLLSAR